MSLAFLLLAHRQPAQVARLFAALYHRDDTFVLHFDRRAPAELHALGAELASSHANVHLLPARRIIWGGPLMGEVQLAAMATALDCDQRWSHFLNLTGQDFPLKSRDEMIARFNQDPNASYVSWFDPLAPGSLWGNARERITRYHLHWPWLHALLAVPGLGRAVRQVFGWTNQLPWLPGYTRRAPAFFRYYGGANHVALSRAATIHLVEDPSAQRIRRWLKAAGHPDEILFQSVLLNSPLAPTIVNETLREIDFPRHAPHPRTFTSADLPRLLRSPALVARSPLHTRHAMDYNNAKVRAEQSFFREVARHRLTGFALRPGVVFGPRSRWITDLVQDLRVGEAWLYRGGAGICNSIYVDNLGFAVQCALSAPAAHAGAYLVGDAETITWRDFYAAIADGLGLDLTAVTELTVLPGFKRSTSARIKRVAASPGVQRLLPFIPGSLKRTTKNLLAAAQVAPSPNAWRLPSAPAPRVTEELALLQQCTWKFSHEPATRQLGYAPRVAFADAMARSLAWLAFAEGRA